MIKSIQPENVVRRNLLKESEKRGNAITFVVADCEDPKREDEQEAGTNSSLVTPPLFHRTAYPELHDHSHCRSCIHTREH